MTPFYQTPPRIKTVWPAISGIPFYEIERSVDGAAFDFPIRVLDNPALGGVGFYHDDNVAAGHTYTYRVKACDNDGCSPPGRPFTSSVNIVWPITGENDVLGNDFHRILHGFNEPIGIAADFGFHQGVDLGRTAPESTPADIVRAPRGGQIASFGFSHDFNIDDNYVVIRVFVGDAPDIDEFDSFNHIADDTITFGGLRCHFEDGIAPLCAGDLIAPGQWIARIGSEHFAGAFVDHVHAQVEDAQHRDARHFLSLFTDPNDRDPHAADQPNGTPPDLQFDENHDGKVLLFRNHADPDLTHYLEYDHDSKPLGGDLDIIVEATDQQGTVPRQAPIDLSYWIEGPEPPQGVKTREHPYKLYDFRNEYFGGTASCSALYDFQDVTNAGCKSRPSCSPNAPVCSCNYDELGTNCNSVIKDPVSAINYPWPILHNFIITHASAEDGSAAHVKPTEYWRTQAEDDGVADPVQANYAAKPLALSANMARFPDGDYTLHVLASDLVHTNVEFTYPTYPRIRLENFPPFIRGLIVREDADGNPVTGGLPDFVGCEVLLYDYKHPGAPAPYPGPGHLSRSQTPDAVAGAERTLCVRVRFSEQMDTTPARFAVDLAPQDGTDVLEFHGAFSQTSMPNDTWSGTMVIPSRPDGDWNSSPGTHAKDATIRVYARDLPDRNGAQRLLDSDGDGTPNFFDGNHRIKLDASPPTRSVAIRSEP